MDRGIVQPNDSKRKREDSLTENDPHHPGTKTDLKRKRASSLTVNVPHHPGIDFTLSLDPQNIESSKLLSVLDYPADRPPSAPPAIRTSQGRSEHTHLQHTMPVVHRSATGPSISGHIIHNAPSSPRTNHALQGKSDCPSGPSASTHNRPNDPVAGSSSDQPVFFPSYTGVPLDTGAGAAPPNASAPQPKAPSEHFSIQDDPIAKHPRRAKDFKIENSVLTNIQGNAVIFRFDSGNSPGEEFKSVLVKHMAGFITVRDLDKIEKRTLSQAIRDLPRAEAAYDDYVSGDRRRVACFEGTRQALLEEIAQCVASSDGPRAYLLFGIAGIGKSTVAQTVSKRADSLRILGASFFFSRDEADRRSAKKFFTTIAFQLCAYDADFAQAIGTALINERGAAATSKEPQRQLEALILEPLQAIAMSRLLPTLIVVDALDECHAEDGQKVLLALAQLVRELPFFKVVLTTRPQPHLQDLLDLLGTHKTFRMEDIERKVVESDIRRYLEYSLSPDQIRNRLPRLRRSWATSEEEIDSLVRAAGVLFIIASTAVLYVLDTAAYNPGSRMKTLQDELSQNRTPFNTLDFYTVILRSAVPPGCGRDIVERYQAVVGTIVLIEDPLPVGALANLIGMAEDDIYYVLDNLQSVISLGSNGVPLAYHKSFLDYIIDDQRCHDADLRITPKVHHTRLATCCLRIMNRHLKRNILGLRSPTQYFRNDHALEDQKLSKDDMQQLIPSELRYASVHWANHFIGADLDDVHLAAEFKMFVEKHLLHWLETLSWICKFGIAYPSVDAVLRHQIMDSDTCRIFSDIRRFVSRDYGKIEQSALYIYHSALPFTPMESLLYNNYQHETLLCRVLGGPAQWDIHISENRHSYSVGRIAFAKDSSRFASWDKGSVKLWDGTSGTPIRTFDRTGIVFAADFSIFAAVQGRVVTIHSVSSSAPVTSFNHPAKVVNMTISFDGCRLAAGLESGIVRVWDIETGTQIADLDGYDDGSVYDGRRLAFSSSGYMLAFTSKDGITLLNGVDTVATLEREAEKPVTFAFSGDGTRLSTLSELSEGNAYSLALWNGENGEFIAAVRNVGENMAISANGSLVATGGFWKSVQLWSGDSLALIGAIPIQRVESLAFSGDVLAVLYLSVLRLYDIKNLESIVTLQIRHPSSLAFSPDGTRLASGTRNGAVNLWDVPSIRASALTPKQPLSPVACLSFSPDCSRLASGRDDGSVELWDTGHMGQPTSCYKLHSGAISALAFSPNGGQLVSGSYDRTVRYWDGGDGVQIGILEYLFPKELTSLAFSSSLIAAATGKAITLWDRTSHHLIHTFEQGSHLLSFSLDGSVLATSFTNNSQSEVVVLDTEKLVVSATFTVNKDVITLFLSPDGSQIAAQCGYYSLSTPGFKFFDVVNQTVISHPENEDFSWVPHLNGIPILWGENILAGRFSARHAWVPVLNIPEDLRVQKFTSRSSMFALGCLDGHILLIQPSQAANR